MERRVRAKVNGTHMAKRRKLTNTNAQGWVSGNHNMHASQVYPGVFCKIVAALHCRALQEMEIPIVA